MWRLLESKSTLQLLQLHGEILDVLRDRKVIRTANNPTGDYAETLFQKAYGWKLENNSSSGHDAVAEGGKKYQIKCRRKTSYRNSRQLSPIRNFEKKRFHFLAAIIFNEDYSVYRAIIIPRKLLQYLRGRHSRHVNGRILQLDDSAWNVPGVIDATKKLQRAAKNL